MFGLIHEGLRQFVIRNFGADAWVKILRKSGLEEEFKQIIVNKSYPDSHIYDILDAICSLGFAKSRCEVWELYGAFHIDYISEIGWDEVMRSLGPDIKDLLNNIGSLHSFVSRFIFKSNWSGPSLVCEKKNGSLILYYHTHRPGIHMILKGLIQAAGRKYYNREYLVTVKQISHRTVELNSRMVEEQKIVFVIEDQCGNFNDIVIEDVNSVRSLDGATLRLNQLDLVSILPFHIIFDKNCKLIQAGKELYNHVPRELMESGTLITKIFHLVAPKIQLDFETIRNFINCIFILEIGCSTNTNIMNGGTRSIHGSVSSYEQNLRLRGQMMLLEGGESIMYLSSPHIMTIPDLLDFGLRLTMMPLHDASRDLILLNQQRLSDVEMNKQLQENNAQLESLARDLESEKGKTEALLKEMLPTTVANQLLQGKTVDACEFSEATVLFSDVPSFQYIVPACEPKEIVALLNNLFTKFDRLVVLHSIYKVETVGDSYMVVGGIPERRPDHCTVICNLALGMLWEARSVIDPINDQPLKIRLGIHSGPVVAGVIGKKMPRYCLFGDTVNTSSRMESHSSPGRIHCSKIVVELAQRNGELEFVNRGMMQVKGKGTMETYFLKSNKRKTIWELVGQETNTKNDINEYEEMAKGMEDDLITAPSSTKSRTCIIA